MLLQNTSDALYEEKEAPLLKAASKYPPIFSGIFQLFILKWNIVCISYVSLPCEVLPFSDTPTL